MKINLPIHLSDKRSSRRAPPPDLEKKCAAIAADRPDFRNSARNALFWVVIGFVLVAHFKIAASEVAIFIGVQMALSLIALYIKARKAKAVAAIGMQDKARSCRQILLSGEYYGLIQALFGVVSVGLTLALLFLFFSEEISRFILQSLPPAYAQDPGLLKKLLLILFSLYAYQFALSAARYPLVKALKETDDYAEANRDYMLIDKKLDLARLLFGGGIILTIFSFSGMPLRFVLLAAGLLAIFAVLMSVEAGNIRKVKLGIEAGTERPSARREMEKYPGEKVTGAIFGILRIAASFREFFKGSGSAVMGVGRNYFPENTLLFTDRRLLFIHVPMPGGDKIIGEKDYVEENLFYHREEMRAKGEKILNTQTLPQILELAIDDLPYSDIKLLTLKDRRFFIEKLDGEKLGYHFPDKEYNATLRELFQRHLAEKFVCRVK